MNAALMMFSLACSEPSTCVASSAFSKEMAAVELMLTILATLSMSRLKSSRNIRIWKPSNAAPAVNNTARQGMSSSSVTLRRSGRSRIKCGSFMAI